MANVAFDTGQFAGEAPPKLARVAMYSSVGSCANISVMSGMY